MRIMDDTQVFIAIGVAAITSTIGLIASIISLWLQRKNNLEMRKFELVHLKMKEDLEIYKNKLTSRIDAIDLYCEYIQKFKEKIRVIRKKIENNEEWNGDEITKLSTDILRTYEGHHSKFSANERNIAHEMKRIADDSDGILNLIKNHQKKDLPIEKILERLDSNIGRYGMLHHQILTYRDDLIDSLKTIE
jgi:hypothetical protein